MPLGTHHMVGYEYKKGEKNMAKGKLKGGNYNSIQVTTTLTTMGKYSSRAICIFFVY
jgi:hypothetical protein